MTKEEIQSFLTRGFLGKYSGRDVDGHVRTATEIIWKAAQDFRLNPQTLLVLLQKEQSLVESQNPSQNQLDWAMGYAVCDDCSKNDPTIQKYRGFANQVHYAAQRIRLSYLMDILMYGKTISGIGPGITSLIDGMAITPKNSSTAALYTYTPHLHGNELFHKIWQRWFQLDYPDGSLLQGPDGGVWLIQYGYRRPIVSRSVLTSRFTGKNPISVTQKTLENLPEGRPLRFANYSILRTPENSLFLLVDDKIRLIDSMEIFRQIGFNPDEIVDIQNSDLIGYEYGMTITGNTEYPQGVLMQDEITGGVYFVENGTKAPLMSREILSQRFLGQTIHKTGSDVLKNYPTVAPVLFPDGTLVGINGQPEVFVIENGQRRYLTDETTFLAFGWKWEDIVWTNARSVWLHPETAVLTVKTNDLIALYNEKEL